MGAEELILLLYDIKSVWKERPTLGALRHGRDQERPIGFLSGQSGRKG
jgi:hypothetical protein